MNFCVIFFSLSWNNWALSWEVKANTHKTTSCCESLIILVFVPQGSSTKDYFLNRTTQSLERYFYLIVFNAYLHEQVMSVLFGVNFIFTLIFPPGSLWGLTIGCVSQYPLAFATSFSRWMCCHAWLYRLLACTNLSELSAPAELVTKGARVLVRRSSTGS